MTAIGLEILEIENIGVGQEINPRSRLRFRLKIPKLQELSQRFPVL